MKMRWLVPAAALALSGCATGYRMVDAGQSVAVANSGLTVTAPAAWNRAGTLTGPGKRAELWTLDGPRLNEITFYGGIPGGKTLFREVDRRDRPLPRFASDMLPTDVVALFETSYRVASGTPLFEVGEIAPAIFAERPGFRFSYSYTLQGEEVRRRGEATGAIVEGLLYLISYEAPEIFYFERDVEDYRAVVASARLNE